VADLADYLDLTVGQAREQFRALALRRPAHGRQVAFLPAETLLFLAASLPCASEAQTNLPRGWGRRRACSLSASRSTAG
jgi:hypothetical protein